MKTHQNLSDMYIRSDQRKVHSTKFLHQEKQKNENH